MRVSFGSGPLLPACVARCWRGASNQACANGGRGAKGPNANLLTQCCSVRGEPGYLILRGFVLLRHSGIRRRAVNAQRVSESKFIPVLRGVRIMAGMDKVVVAVNKAYEKKPHRC